MPLHAARRALDLASGETLVTARLDRALRVASEGRAGERSGAMLEVTAVRDGQVGVAVADSFEEDAIAAAVASAEADAQAGAGPGDYPGLPSPGAMRAHDGFDPATAALDEDAARARLAGLPSGAALAAGELRIAAVSSRGLEATDAATVARATVTVGDGLVAQATARSVDGLDLDGLAERVAWLAQAAEARDGAAPPSGLVRAVLAPEALAAILGAAAAAAFDGRAHRHGEGPLAGRLGTRVAAAAINLSDSPRFTLTLPRLFDAEGVPKAPLPLVQDGVAHRVVHDVYSGRGHSTGHAIAPGGTAHPAPRNLVLVGGGAQDEDELASPIDHGVFLPALEATDVIDPSTARFMALAPAPLAIEGGRIAGRLEPVRVEATLFEVLDGVEALTARPRLVALARDWGVVAPAVRVRELLVAG